jgi:hypothetical protein
MGNTTNRLDGLKSKLTSAAPETGAKAARSPDGPVMAAAEQEEFWRLYAKVAMPAIERSCRGFSRALTDNAMSAEDMTAWVDERVWKMLRKGAWPVFHDSPSPQEAAERLAQKSKLLARWAYMGLSRSTWRRKAREAKYLSGMSRSERLAAVSSTPADLERMDEVHEDLERIRKAVSAKTRTQAAASWHEPEDRRRIAMVLGVTGPGEEAVIARAETGEIKANTLDQMRSRTRKEIRSILKGPGATVLVLIVSMLALVLGAAPAQAGEQTGGRPGGRAEVGAVKSGAIMSGHALLAREGEQTGGRP